MSVKFNKRKLMKSMQFFQSLPPSVLENCFCFTGGDWGSKSLIEVDEPQEKLEKN